MYRTFIFYRPDLCSVSPAVSLWWPDQVIDLLNQLPVGALHYGGMAGAACADFIVACRGLLPREVLPGVMATQGSEVDNLPLRWDRLEALEGSPDTLEYVSRWCSWLFEEIEHLTVNTDDRRWLPVMIDLDPPYHATQGGEVLCRRLMSDYREGGPQWVASG